MAGRKSPPISTRGVRTVQRWERTLGLPVRRAGSGRGEVVYAFADELDAWGRQTTRAQRDLNDEPNGAGPSLAPPPPSAPSPASGPIPLRPSWRLPVLAVAAFFTVATGAGALWLHRDRVVPPPQPVDLRLDGDTLTVLGAEKRVLWTYSLKGPLAQTTPGATNRGSWSIIDIDQDGRHEVLFGKHTAESTHDEFICFNDDGSVRFSSQPVDSVRFGNTTFAAPWQFHRLFVLDVAGTTQLWVVWTHRDFPSFVERLSSSGKRLAQYWNGGHIGWISTGVIGGRRVVLVGAAANDCVGASLAVYDEDQVGGAAPAMDPEHVCATCPSGQPRRFLVFPRLEILRALGANAGIAHVLSDERGGLSVWVAQVGGGVQLPPGLDGADVSYTFDADLELRDADVSAEYKAAHEWFEKAHVLDHAFSQREIGELLPLQSWDGAKFVSIGKGESARIVPPRSSVALPRAD